MNLTMLLEKENSINSKIKQAIKKIKEWFEKKKEQAKDIFEETKDKIIEKINKVAKKDLEGKKLKDDIKIKNKDGKEEILARKGENALSVFSRLNSSVKSVLTKIKVLCQKIISECQKGLRKLAGIDEDTFKNRELVEITTYKKSVTNHIIDLEDAVLKSIKIAKGIGTLTIMASIGAVIIRDKDMIKDGVNHVKKGSDFAFNVMTGGAYGREKKKSEINNVEYEVH